MKIDFVSDVSCPWCAIGLQSLLQAIDRLGEAVPVTLRLQPFELNPQMPAEGEALVEHLGRKYGLDAAAVAHNREAIRERGAAVGFEFRADARDRIYNTFDAHRLLHWAGETAGPAAQRALKLALLRAYFTEGRSPGDAAVLQAAAVEAGLDGATAAEVIASGAGTAEVRAAQQHWQAAGIRSVPSLVIDDTYLIQGGQPPEVFEQALREIAARPAAA